MLCGVSWLFTDDAGWAELLLLKHALFVAPICTALLQHYSWIVVGVVVGIVIATVVVVVVVFPDGFSHVHTLKFDE